MNMHFKLGLYEHQSASAIDGLINILSANDHLLSEGNPSNIEKIKITSYEPAFSIIGDPAKLTPTTRQSADHSMVYIIATLLRKAFDKHEFIQKEHTTEELWKYLMLLPHDYSQFAIFNETTRELMSKIEFQHGGPEYDAKYPEGIPTSVSITSKSGEVYESGLVEFPGGHARNETVSVTNILQHKFKRLGKLSLEKEELVQFVMKLESLEDMDNEQLLSLYECNIKLAD